MNFTKEAPTVFSLTVALLASTSVYAETLYGTNTITIETNTAIIINCFGPRTQFYIDGQYMNLGSLYAAGAGCAPNPRLAIAGHHTLTLTNAYDGEPTDAFVTFQLLKSPVIKTMVLSVGQTSTVTVPEGKTIQFYDLPSFLIANVQPSNSARSYSFSFGSIGGETGNFTYSHPSATGPATVTVSNPPSEVAEWPGFAVFVSYYIITTPEVEAPTDLIY
jgi:hypothetical protein